jgi:hypothetical protein
MEIARNRNRYRNRGRPWQLDVRVAQQQLEFDAALRLDLMRKPHSEAIRAKPFAGA